MTYWTAICLMLLFSSPALRLRAQTTGGYQPTISKVWDDAVMKDLEIPLARAEYSPRHVPASFYYQVPVRPIYKSYPVYHPDREPHGYIDWLRSREPEIDWDAAKLKTKEDWIRAGETVFDAPLGYGSIMLTKERLANVEDLYVRKPAFFSAVQPPLSTDGIHGNSRPAPTIRPGSISGGDRGRGKAFMPAESRFLIFRHATMPQVPSPDTGEGLGCGRFRVYLP